MAESLITTVEEAVVTLRINRPDRGNRLNLDVLERMEAALRRADENEDGYAFSGDLLVDLLTHPEVVAALASRKENA